MVHRFDPQPPDQPPRGLTPGRPRRELRNPTATWVAGVGAALVLLAALVLVVDAWNEIRPEVKLLGLVACNVGVAVAAGAARRSAPAVARVLAHLAAMLAVPAGVAAAATGGATWPVAICLGGAVGVVSGLATHGRWRAPWLVPAAEASAVLALAGVAGLTDIPLGVLVAALALVRLAAVWVAEGGAVTTFFNGARPVGMSGGPGGGPGDMPEGMSVASGWAGTTRLALVAAAMPCMALLGRYGIGPGTMERLGARGEALTWAGPVAGTVAAVVLAMVAWRHRSVLLLPASLSSLLVGWAMAIPNGVEGRWWWNALPALVVLLTIATAEALAADPRPIVATTRSGPQIPALPGSAPTPFHPGELQPVPLWHRLPTELRAGVSAVLVMISISFPFLLGPVLWQRPESAGAAMCLGLWAAALLAAGLPGRLPGWWIPSGVLFRVQALVVLVAFGGVVLSGDGAQVLAAAGITVGLAALHLGTATRWNQTPWYGLLPERVAAAGLTLLLLIGLRAQLGWDPARWVSLAALAAVAAVVGAGRVVRHRRAEEPSITVAMLGGSHPETVMDHLLALAAGLTMALVWPAGSDLVTAIAGLGAGVVVLACGWHRHSVAAVLPALGLLLAQQGGLTLEQSLQLSLVGAVALTGAAGVFSRWTPLASGAVAASVTVLAGAIEHHHVLVSLAATLLGTQLFWYASLREWAVLRWVGAGVGALGAASLPVTTGWLPWLLDALEARGISGTDVAAAAVTVAMLAAGAVMQHRMLTIPAGAIPGLGTSWATLGPGLVLGGLYLISTQAARAQEGRLAVALAFGVLAVGAGGRWRLAAPLLGGSVMLSVVVVQATGERLAALPAWSWLAIGGASLLLVGLSIERRSLPAGPPSGTSGEGHGDGGGGGVGTEADPDGLLTPSTLAVPPRRLWVALWQDLR
ncbi:MAG: hypothetical protein ACKV2O_12475 [Acidimicrobiales bacterium]